MVRTIAGALFLAMTLAISMGLPAQVEQYCSFTLAPCDSQICGSDQCDSQGLPAENGCCFLATEDWEGFPVPTTVSVSVELFELDLPDFLSFSEVPSFSFLRNTPQFAPDPPPFSGKMLLTHLERHLI